MDSYSVEIKYKKGWMLNSIFEKYLIAVLVRFSASIFGAITLFVLLNSGFITVALTGKNNFIVYSLAILAGFSENLVPNMMTKFETSVVTKDAIRVTPEPTIPSSTAPTGQPGQPPPTIPTQSQTNLPTPPVHPGTQGQGEDEGSVG
jgi:hypothetical protein